MQNGMKRKQQLTDDKEMQMYLIIDQKINNKQWCCTAERNWYKRMKEKYKREGRLPKSQVDDGSHFQPSSNPSPEAYEPKPLLKPLPKPLPEAYEPKPPSRPPSRPPPKPSSKPLPKPLPEAYEPIRQRPTISSDRRDKNPDALTEKNRIEKQLHAIMQKPTQYGNYNLFTTGLNGRLYFTIKKDGRHINHYVPKLDYMPSEEQLRAELLEDVHYDISIVCTDEGSEHIPYLKTPPNSVVNEVVTDGGSLGTCYVSCILTMCCYCLIDGTLGECILDDMTKTNFDSNADNALSLVLFRYAKYYTELSMLPCDTTDLRRLIVQLIASFIYIQPPHFLRENTCKPFSRNDPVLFGYGSTLLYHYVRVKTRKFNRTVYDAVVKFIQTEDRGHKKRFILIESGTLNQIKGCDIYESSFEGEYVQHVQFNGFHYSLLCLHPVNNRWVLFDDMGYYGDGGIYLDRI